MGKEKGQRGAQAETAPAQPRRAQGGWSYSHLKRPKAAPPSPEVSDNATSSDTTEAAD